jgi:ATP-dependent Lon protease
VAVQRKGSIKAIDFAMQYGRMACFVTQRDPEIDNPKEKDLFKVGVVAKIREIVKQPDDTIRILIEGISRMKIKEYIQEEPFIKVKYELQAEVNDKKTEKIEALMYSVINLFKECVNLGVTVPLDILLLIVNIKNPWRLADLIALHINFKLNEKQEILEAMNVEEKLQEVSNALSRQIKVLKIAKKIESNTGEELGKMQKEMFLREQLKSIEKELGVVGGESEGEELEKKIKKAGMPKETEKKALKELKRMLAMPSFSPEISYIRTYLDWLIELPWSKKSESKIDITGAEKILNEDHYGLKKIKERIVEYLAVHKMVGKIKGPILCFVGPPGTGKTSIGKSIARSLGRKFIRISLGGIRDEAEIRGHRRTYVGAMPGRIIQGMNNAGTRNPVFMLDEIDKVGNDFRGDPSSALLEALDPEQNSEFSDHYVEFPFDLSDVMFITTANVLDTIPPALRDRMEVIEFSGYTYDEKYNIAKKYLMSKQLKEHGLSRKQLNITKLAMYKIIEEYTREAGVRNLEREIATVCRKVAKKISTDHGKEYKINIDNLANYLGPVRYQATSKEKKNEVGVAMGLAWTQAGGEILPIEAIKMPGKGQLILTGHLGKVMKESAQAAFSYAKNKAASEGIKDKFYRDIDVHIHVPAGAIPKDGPSAGLAIASVLVSLLTNRKIDRQIAMTGEVTLRGKAMEIGGVKEKVLAAHQAEMKKVILPKDNKKDLVDVPKEVKKNMKFVFVENMNEVLKEVLEK